MQEQATEYDACEAKQISPVEQSIDRVCSLLDDHQHLLISLEKRLASVCRPEVLDSGGSPEKACDPLMTSPTVTRILDVASSIEVMSESVQRLIGRLDVS